MLSGCRLLLRLIIGQVLRLVVRQFLFHLSFILTSELFFVLLLCKHNRLLDVLNPLGNVLASKIVWLWKLLALELGRSGKELLLTVYHLNWSEGMHDGRGWMHRQVERRLLGQYLLMLWPEVFVIRSFKRIEWLLLFSCFLRLCVILNSFRHLIRRRSTIWAHLHRHWRVNDLRLSLSSLCPR